MLILSAFFAGVLMFLAPCTLPLLPGYLAFISGVDSETIDRASKDPALFTRMRRHVFLNGCMYVLGFTVVFMLFGTLAGFASQALSPALRVWLMRLGGVFAIVLGLHMLGAIRIRALASDVRMGVGGVKGRWFTSLLLGAAFALGWTPCVGPILATVLFLASGTGTAAQGTFLLAVFSAGMALPFLIIAWSIGSAYKKVRAIQRFMPIITRVGGGFMIVMGLLLLANKLGLFLRFGGGFFYGFY